MFQLECDFTKKEFLIVMALYSPHFKSLLPLSNIQDMFMEKKKIHVKTFK